MSIDGDVLRITDCADVDGDLLPSNVDLQVRRLVEQILNLLRPRCSRCSRPLSAPESVRRGLGPDCCRKAVVV